MRQIFILLLILSYSVLPAQHKLELRLEGDLLDEYVIRNALDEELNSAMSHEAEPYILLSSYADLNDFLINRIDRAFQLYIYIGHESSDCQVIGPDRLSQMKYEDLLPQIENVFKQSIKYIHFAKDESGVISFHIIPFLDLKYPVVYELRYYDLNNQLSFSYFVYSYI